MRPTTDTPLSVSEEASRWLCELQDADEMQHARFFAWLRRSPRHVEELLFVTALWKELGRFGEAHPLKVEALLAQAAAEDERCRRVVRLRVSDAADGELARSARTWTRPRILAAASLTIFALAAAAVLAFLGSRPTYVTGAGEQRLIRLEDGSRVHLNTRSRLTVKYTDSGRNLRLLEGEALFTVAPDGRRPFLVRSGATVVQALGTQFNVYRRGSGITVSVLEGSVRISAKEPSTPAQLESAAGGERHAAPSLQLDAGEQAKAGASGSIQRESTPDLPRAVAWQQQRIIFRSDRLEDAVAEVNRYAVRPIRVEGRELRDMRISAIFDANDPDSLVRFLREFDGIAVTSEADEVVIRSAAPPER